MRTIIIEKTHQEGKGREATRYRPKPDESSICQRRLTK